MSEVLFEFVKQGNVVKVTAIEPNTAIEAVVVLPANLSESEMKTRAMQKLIYVLKKEEKN
ncbi:MAG: hypothetical protein E7017_00915 [Alphaproteobacteria bacterium]|nr:hypothetical protein [Alphaproteobacteria bacterium]